MAMRKTQLHLPVIGTDWLSGCVGKYIILSLKHSTKGAMRFWMANDCGYTEYLCQAGIYTQERVTTHIGRYNDGISTIAIPLTATALGELGLVFEFNISQETLERFLSVERAV